MEHPFFDHIEVVRLWILKKQFFLPFCKFDLFRKAVKFKKVSFLPLPKNLERGGKLVEIIDLLRKQAL